MSVKINIKIVTGERTTRCRIEVPLDAIRATGAGYEEVQERITDLTSNAVLSVLCAAENNQTKSTGAGSEANTAIKLTNDNDARPEKRRRTTGNDDHEQKPLVVVDARTQIHTIGTKDFVSIKLRDLRKDSQDMNIRIDRNLPLKQALDVYSLRDGIPIDQLRFFVHGRASTGEESASKLNLQDGAILIIALLLRGS